MKYCSRCGHQLTGGGAFCGQCGNAVTPALAPTAAPAEQGGAAPQAQTSPPQPPGAADPLAALGSQIRAVPWTELVPLRAWWSDGGWRQGWVGLFSVFAIAPFILLQLTAGDEDVHRIAWGFALYFALLWFV